MFELIFGKRPFDGDTNELVKESILNDPIVMPKDVYISKECQQVIEGLLTRSPKHRLGHGAQGFEKLKSHAWFQGLDWESLENKTAVPPFIPNTNQSNFDAVHELEELLFDDTPLRPHKKTSAQNGKMKELIDMDSKFLPYDYTKHHSNIPSSSSNLIRRVGSALNDKMDQTKYTSQGYIELSTAASTTTNTTACKK
ncbi:hypothetical protein G6F42_026436 [Rhizopus arrhizus]|nr:hypothetical protein G6F42_026436 [Rhizopus arrhizus]